MQNKLCIRVLNSCWFLITFIYLCKSGFPFTMAHTGAIIVFALKFQNKYLNRVDGNHRKSVEFSSKTKSNKKCNKK